MNKTNGTLMTEARALLKGKWRLPITITLKFYESLCMDSIDLNLESKN